MLNFCPLCVVEVYALRCDAMRAGTSHYPLHRPTTTYYLWCKYMQFFCIHKIHAYQSALFRIKTFRLELRSFFDVNRGSSIFLIIFAEYLHDYE